MATAPPFPDGLPDTFFDTPDRLSGAAVAIAAGRVRSNQGLSEVLNGLPTPTFVLYGHRQIVATNPAGSALVRLLGGSEITEGLRMGEALACVNVANGPGGCGTAPQCQHCAAGQANRAFTSQPMEYDAEFRLRSSSPAGESSQTFRIHLAPLSVSNEPMRLCTLTDITAAKSRDVLQQIFFHDVLNTAQAVSGASSLMTEQDDPDVNRELAQIVSVNAAKVIIEIEAQRDLIHAEDGRLRVRLQPERASRVLVDVAELYRRSPHAEGRSIHVVLSVTDDLVSTNLAMLSRCVGNLVKNALEATAVGDRVTLAATDDDNDVYLTVHNPSVMPADVQAHMFQRFFSTKRQLGRGLGTYSVRLIVHGYLGGQVSFISVAGAGTTFVVRLPKARTSRLQ